MTVSVTWNGSTITNATVTAGTPESGWSVVKVTSGGGTPGVEPADGSIDGDGAITTTSNQKRILLYYDLGAGNELDFSGGGAQEGQFVYIWANFLAASLLNPYQSGGFGVFMDSNAPSSNQHALWYVYGSDNYSGGWKRFIIDPTTTPSTNPGTAINTAAIRYIGIFAETNATARFDNMIVDRMDVGNGYDITGTSTLGLMQEVLNYEKSGSPLNVYGVVKSLNDSDTAFELAGTLNLGDTTATNSTISDNDSKIFVAEPIYYNGTADAPSVPTTAFGINVVGGAGVESLTLGNAVGTSGGRNGITLVGNSTYDFAVDFSDGNVETGNWFGCSLENLSGALSFDAASHSFKGNSVVNCTGMSFVTGSSASECSFVSCGTVSLAGTASLTDCIFAEADANAVQTADLDNLSDCSFTRGSAGHAVELTSIGDGSMGWNCKLTGYATGSAGSPVTPTNNGDEAIFVNVGSGSLTITVADGAATPSIRSAGATVTVQVGLKTLTISNVISGSDVVIKTAGTLTKLQDDQDIAGTSTTYTYTYSAGTFVDVAVYAEGYVPYYVNGFGLGPDGGTIQVAQVADRNYVP